ncbi:unnamed protein product [Caretta caretta]
MGPPLHWAASPSLGPRKQARRDGPRPWTFLRGKTPAGSNGGARNGVRLAGRGRPTPTWESGQGNALLETLQKPIRIQPRRPPLHCAGEKKLDKGLIRRPLRVEGGIRLSQWSRHLESQRTGRWDWEKVWLNGELRQSARVLLPKLPAGQVQLGSTCLPVTPLHGVK